jgi:hypothetical protein
MIDLFALLHDIQLKNVGLYKILDHLLSDILKEHSDSFNLLKHQKQ